MQNTIEEKDKKLEEKDKKIEEKDNTITEHKNTIEEKDNKIAELKDYQKQKYSELIDSKNILSLKIKDACALASSYYKKINDLSAKFTTLKEQKERTNKKLGIAQEQEENQKIDTFKKEIIDIDKSLNQLRSKIHSIYTKYNEKSNEAIKYTNEIGKIDAECANRLNKIREEKYTDPNPFIALEKYKMLRHKDKKVKFEMKYNQFEILARLGISDRILMEECKEKTKFHLKEIEAHSAKIKSLDSLKLDPKTLKNVKSYAVSIANTLLKLLQMQEKLEIYAKYNNSIIPNQETLDENKNIWEGIKKSLCQYKEKINLHITTLQKCLDDAIEAAKSLVKDDLSSKLTEEDIYAQAVKYIIPPQNQQQLTWEGAIDATKAGTCMDNVENFLERIQSTVDWRAVIVHWSELRDQYTKKQKEQAKEYTTKEQKIVQIEAMLEDNKTKFATAEKTIKDHGLVITEEHTKFLYLKARTEALFTKWGDSMSKCEKQLNSSTTTRWLIENPCQNSIEVAQKIDTAIIQTLHIFQNTRQNGKMSLILILSLC